MFEVQVQLLIAIPVPNNEASSSSMTPKSGRLSTEHTVFHGCPCADFSAIHLFSKKYPINVVQSSLHSFKDIIFCLNPSLFYWSNENWKSMNLCSTLGESQSFFIFYLRKYLYTN